MRCFQLAHAAPFAQAMRKATHHARNGPRAPFESGQGKGKHAMSGTQTEMPNKPITSQEFGKKQTGLPLSYPPIVLAFTALSRQA